jgi:hypothetical protein
MVYIPEKRLEALDALIRTAEGGGIRVQINNDLSALLVKAESQVLTKKINCPSQRKVQKMQPY